MGLGSGVIRGYKGALKVSGESANPDASEGAGEGQWEMEAKPQKLSSYRSRRAGEAKGGQCPWRLVRLRGGRRASRG